MAADRPTLAQRLLRAWQHRGPLAWSLWPLSLIYRVLLSGRRWTYRLGWQRSHRLPVPVLVVGNVVVGGAGKTPTVVGLVDHLRERGWRPGIISRGHGRQGEQPLDVAPDTDSALCGDEPLLLARATGVPLVVGRDRAAAGRHLLAQHPEVDLLVSDDGMQHWALARDLTVVVFDGRGTGNGWLLPAGLLREPWPAQPWGDGRLLVLNSQTVAAPGTASPYPTFVANRRLAAHAWNSVQMQQAMDALRERDNPIGALAGIAQPQAFFDLLSQQGVPLQHRLALPDHADAATLLRAVRQHPADTTWLCTEKDAVKLFPMLKTEEAERVWAVPLVQTLPSDFLDAVDQALDGLSSRHGHQTP